MVKAKRGKTFYGGKIIFSYVLFFLLKQKKKEATFFTDGLLRILLNLPWSRVLFSKITGMSLYNLNLPLLSYF